jgi:SAM-dependent methyltransferase
MMHDAARLFVAEVCHDGHYPYVVDVGGRIVNGDVRGLVAHDAWTTIDLEAGPGVDVVADCRQWSPPMPADLVLCCEVLEHAPDPAGVVAACVGYLRPGGRLVLTCAAPGRLEHSGHDGGELRDGEWYANINPARLKDWCAGLQQMRVDHNMAARDVYVTGTKP